MQFNEDHWLGENLWSFARYPTLMPGDLDMCKHAKDAVNSFYAEIELYTYPLGDEPFHKCSGLDKVSKFGHFVQMMFDKVTQIGCSYASCIGYDPAGLFQMPKIIVNCYYNERKLFIFYHKKLLRKFSQCKKQFGKYYRWFYIKDDRKIIFFLFPYKLSKILSVERDYLR